MKNNTSVNDLVQHLKHIYALPKVNKSFQQKDLTKSSKQQFSNGERHHWKTSGIVHDQKNIQRLPARDLDNWQLMRMNMSKRSYQYPKNFKGIKVSAVNREFNKFDGRGKNGQIPYLYESDLPKIQKIRQRMNSIPFKPTRKISHQIFGFAPKQIKSKSSFCSYSNLKKSNTNHL